MATTAAPVAGPAPDTARAPSPAEIAALLADARERTLLLIATIPEDRLYRQHDRLMSPIAWDLGHIAHFEELWLLRNLEGPVRFGEMPGTFNPFENPRATRSELDLPGFAETLDVLARVRREVLDSLGAAPPDGNPLLHGGYVYRMVAQHEYQHGETVLQALQLMEDPPYRAPRAVAPPPGRPVAADAEGFVRFPGGRVEIGTDDRAAAYDNERPRHTVDLAPFHIGAAPVTNGQFLSFMETGGYAEAAHWSEAGWRWRQEAGVDAPQFWRRDGDGWAVRSMDRVEPLDPLHPVCHVCWYEAEAYATWAGCRLPTEQEWEAAAAWDPAEERARTYPWGDAPPTPLDANLDQLAFGAAQVGAYPRNVSPIGCHGMIGDVWEWTASEFRPYPGYETFPYPEYSEVFFGPEYRVLRGGSWATRPGAVRSTFRNWDYPIRRQIFAGFRVARDG
jgi:gamma-glutamyl hercynylcysteine S-oxide synthase